jgi:glycosyltransferase involved in cell wall biosynthesis
MQPKPIVDTGREKFPGKASRANLTLVKIPTVSIGLPVYNAAQFLDETIRSILRQSYADFELIISDNASTDRTFHICRSYAQRDGRIRLFQNEINQGAAYNYNRVLELARGRFFLWHAMDDLIDPEFLAVCVELLNNNPSASVAYTGARVIDSNGVEINIQCRPVLFDSMDLVQRFSSALDPIPYNDCAIFGMMRRKILHRTRGMGAYLAADRCFTAELLLHGFFVKSPRVLFSRRKHANNVGTSEKFLAWWSPRLIGQVTFPLWRVLFEDTRAVKRSDLSWYMKFKLYGVLACWGFRRRISLLYELKKGLFSLAAETCHRLHRQYKNA